MNQILKAAVMSALAVFLTSGVLGQEGMPGPGPEHEFLKKFVGKWTANLKSGAGDSMGTITYQLECGGLWLVSSFEGDFGGMKFQGRGLDGYDPQKKKYVSVWVDSMTPRPTIFEGGLDDAKKTLTMVGEGLGMDGQPVKFKSVTKLRDGDHMDFTMYMVNSDGESEMMSIEYVRVK
jgi:hypothetical protein